MSNHNPKNQFQKGKSGNPNGRPSKGYSITEWFQEMFKAKPEVKDAIAKSIVKKALEGDTTAIKLVWNYMDGMPKESKDLYVKELPKPLLSSLDQETDVSNHNGLTETEDTE